MATTPPASWTARVRHIHKEARQAYKKVMKDFTAKLTFSQLTRTHKRLRANAKKSHRAILQGDAAPPPSLTALRSTLSPTVFTEPSAILQEAASQYGAAKQPPITPLSGNVPWGTASAGLTPCTLRTVPEEMRHTPLRSFLTKEAFTRCLFSMHNRRAAGPNGIPAEILKHLPQEYHNLLYDACCLYLETGQAPPSWKHSETILLHKKGDPTILKNWRPIGLADSAGKLYHAVLADCLYRYSSCAGLLSDTQFGFRRDRNCQQALMYVLSLFEDSHASQRDIYVAYIDL